MREEFNGTTVSIGLASISIQKLVLYGSDVRSSSPGFCRLSAILLVRKVVLAPDPRFVGVCVNRRPLFLTACANGQEGEPFPLILAATAIHASNDGHRRSIQQYRTRRGYLDSSPKLPLFVHVYVPFAIRYPAPSVSVLSLS